MVYKCTFKKIKRTFKPMKILSLFLLFQTCLSLLSWTQNILFLKIFCRKKTLWKLIATSNWKHLLLCSTEERNSHTLGTTWGRVWQNELSLSFYSALSLFTLFIYMHLHLEKTRCYWFLFTLSPNKQYLPLFTLSVNSIYFPLHSL